MAENKISLQEYKEKILSYYSGIIEHMPEDHAYSISDTLECKFEGRDYDDTLDYDQAEYEVHNEILKKLKEIETDWKIGFVARSS